jgi:hypothetical protein
VYCSGHNLLPLVEIGLATAPQPPSCNGPEVCGAINTSVCILGQGGRGNMAPHILPENLISICINHRKQITLPHFYSPLHNFGPSAISAVLVILSSFYRFFYAFPKFTKNPEFVIKYNKFATVRTCSPGMYCLCSLT